MTDATYTLHLMLIRLAKGAVRAWEQWVKVSCGSIEIRDAQDARQIGLGADRTLPTTDVDDALRAGRFPAVPRGSRSREVTR